MGRCGGGSAAACLGLLLLAVLARISSSGSDKNPIVWDGNGWIPLPAGDVGPAPHPPHSDSWKRANTTIYIGISSFRDARCPKTLYNFYTKATYPARVFISVVQQNSDKDDPDCLAGYCKLMGASGEGPGCPHIKNIRPVRIDYKLAAGPCFGRHLQSYELRDEEFCMQTDSHMDTVKGWDVKLLEMWGRANNEYGVLTTYVHQISQLGEAALEDKREVPHLCQISFPSGNPRYVQAKLAMRLPKPKLTNSWAAGFSLAKCHAWKAVPYDPHLKMVFDGEEFGTAARLWTRGYDMYTPDYSIVGHDYNPVKDGPSPQSWGENANYDKLRREAYLRLHSMLQMKGGIDTPEMRESIGRYGLGNRRSMEQYQRFVGVNLTTLEITQNRCGAIEWVPFKEDWPPTENNLGGPYWERKLASVRADKSRGQGPAAAPYVLAPASGGYHPKGPDMDMIFGVVRPRTDADEHSDHIIGAMVLAAAGMAILAAIYLCARGNKPNGNGIGGSARRSPHRRDEIV